MRGPGPRQPGLRLPSLQMGLLTTVAIVLHEIPHEVSPLPASGGDPAYWGQGEHATLPQVGDFAILLRAGFDRWSAAKLQLSTALGGLLGACFAICTQSPKGVGTGTLAHLPWGRDRTLVPWARSQSGSPPTQRRQWPGSCPSRPAASSTSP